MSHLLDTDIYASVIHGVRTIKQHCAQHTGNMCVSVVSITELELWLLRFRTPLAYRQLFFNFQQSVVLLDVTEPIAHRAAMLGNKLKNQGQKIGLGDSLIAATALEKGLILVTRKIAPFTNIPGLTVVDWHIP